jgi:hypothetical protein
MTFHVYRKETTHYALSRNEVETLLGYEPAVWDIRVAIAGGKTNAELAQELKDALDGDGGFEIVGVLPNIDRDADVVEDSSEVTVQE